MCTCVDDVGSAATVKKKSVQYFLHLSSLQEAFMFFPFSGGGYKKKNPHERTHTQQGKEWTLFIWGDL